MRCSHRHADVSLTWADTASAFGPSACSPVGRELARELIEESRAKAAGVYLVAPFRQPLGILEVL